MKLSILPTNSSNQMIEKMYKNCRTLVTFNRGESFLFSAMIVLWLIEQVIS